MKFAVLLLSLLSAALLSALSAIYASGKLKAPEPVATEDPAAPGDFRITLFPEQSKAVDELLKANIARQEELERQEKLLAEQSAAIRQESLVLARLREELATIEKQLDEKTALAEADMNAAKAALDSQLNKTGPNSSNWDAEEQKNTRKLAEFYARMEPQNAAKLLSKIEVERAARILTFLSDRQAGAILDASVALGADGMELAVKLTEIIRQMKAPQKPPE